MDGRQIVISIDRLKPAFLEASDFFPTTPTQQLPVPIQCTEQPSKSNASISRHDPETSDPVPKASVITRSDRHIRFNLRYH